MKAEMMGITRHVGLYQFVFVEWKPGGRHAVYQKYKRKTRVRIYRNNRAVWFEVVRIM